MATYTDVRVKGRVIERIQNESKEFYLRPHGTNRQL